jgi:hypothetical protein
MAVIAIGLALWGRHMGLTQGLLSILVTDTAGGPARHRLRRVQPGLRHCQAGSRRSGRGAVGLFGPGRHYCQAPVSRPWRSWICCGCRGASVSRARGATEAGRGAPRRQSGDRPYRDAPSELSRSSTARAKPCARTR